MKKRLFGLVAMMLAAMIFVLAFPVQVKAETYNLANVEHGTQFVYGDNIKMGSDSGAQAIYYIDKKNICKKYCTEYVVLKDSYYPSAGNIYFDRYEKDGTDSDLYHVFLVTTLKSNSSIKQKVSAPKITPEQQAILDYNDAWDKVQKEYADETQMPVETFMTAQAIASVPENVKNNSTAIANLKSLKTVPGVMALINKAQKATTGDIVTIYTENPMTFSNEGFEAISDQNKTVEYAFKIDGVLYQITIPAGAKVNFGDNTYVGPLWIGAQLGTTAILE